MALRFKGPSPAPSTPFDLAGQKAIKNASRDHTEGESGEHDFDIDGRGDSCQPTRSTPVGDQSRAEPGAFGGQSGPQHTVAGGDSPSLQGSHTLADVGA